MMFNNNNQNTNNIKHHPPPAQGQTQPHTSTPLHPHTPTPLHPLTLLLIAALTLACNLSVNLATPPPTTAARATVPPTNTPQPAATSLVAGTTPAGQPGVVVDVVDGDTIDVEIDGEVRRLRYIGVDTPERGEPFHDQAAQANRDLVLGQDVILVRDVSQTDRFGRLLRYVYLPDGTFVNGELVARGFALAATFPPDVAQQALLSRLQRQARQRGAGLWADAASEPPPSAQPGEANVVIAFIFHDGQEGPNEPDEYAVIANEGHAPVNLAGWRLNAGAPGQDFTFPSFQLQPGQSCRVYTNQRHPGTCGFSFDSPQPLWRNAGDCAALFDPTGAQISQHCY